MRMLRNSSTAIGSAQISDEKPAYEMVRRCTLPFRRRM
jgi:hypothetical protein